MLKKFVDFIKENVSHDTNVNYNNGWYSLNFDIRDAFDVKNKIEFGVKIPLGVYSISFGGNLIDYHNKTVTGSLVSRENEKLESLLKIIKDKEIDILSSNSVVYVGASSEKILIFNSIEELDDLFDFGTRFTTVNVNPGVIDVTKKFYDSLEDKTIQHEDIPKTNKIYSVFSIKSMEMYKEQIVCLVDVTSNVEQYLKSNS